MKQKFHNLTIFSFFYAVFFFFFIKSACQDTQTRTIYDFYSDQHDLGRWQGYAYYLYPDLSAKGDIGLKKLIINETALLMEDVGQFAPHSFTFICDYEENLPCSVAQFKKMFGSNFKDFGQNIDILLNKTNIVDSGDQCIVLHIRQNSSLIPYLICLYVSEQGVNLKSAVKIFI